MNIKLLIIRKYIYLFLLLFSLSYFFLSTNNAFSKNLKIENIKIIKSNDELSYVELNPITGRKHQLRKQLLNIGNPIIGDEKYFLPNFRKIKTKKADKSRPL